jgi:hypothetical protein
LHKELLEESLLLMTSSFTRSDIFEKRIAIETVPPAPSVSSGLPSTNSEQGQPAREALRHGAVHLESRGRSTGSGRCKGPENVLLKVMLTMIRF